MLGGQRCLWKPLTCHQIWGPHMPLPTTARSTVDMARPLAAHCPRRRDVRWRLRQAYGGVMPVFVALVRSNSGSKWWTQKTMWIHHRETENSFPSNIFPCGQALEICDIVDIWMCGTEESLVCLFTHISDVYPIVSVCIYIYIGLSLVFFWRMTIGFSA